MTLNLSLVTPRYVIQVSDRRLSRLDASGKLVSYTDDLTKATVLVTCDTFSVVAYHGIGMDHTRLRTDDWLVGVLTELKPADKPLTEVLETLNGKASKWISDISSATGINLGEFRHSFVLSGWQFDERSFTFLVSHARRVHADVSLVDDKKSLFLCWQCRKNGLVCQWQNGYNNWA